MNTHTHTHTHTLRHLGYILVGIVPTFANMFGADRRRNIRFLFGRVVRTCVQNAMQQVYNRYDSHHLLARLV